MTVFPELSIESSAQLRQSCAPSSVSQSSSCASAPQRSQYPVSFSMGAASEASNAQSGSCLRR
jgi:hypothetical protein